ncbi:HNH endonuclease [Variovorax sp. H27-G14]|uniref:HNH endonuclease n=1 Tax=Variovorax sp. H27-G14 TaxID=3111914 RepID=UPI0038FCA9AB
MSPRIPAAATRISMATSARMQKAPRIAATPRTRGRKWMTRRERWLMANPLCIACHAEGRVMQAQEVDHRIPLWAGGQDDESNYQSLCIEHHKAKTARESKDRARSCAGL